MLNLFARFGGRRRGVGRTSRSPVRCRGGLAVGFPALWRRRLRRGCLRFGRPVGRDRRRRGRFRCGGPVRRRGRRRRTGGGRGIFRLYRLRWLLRRLRRRLAGRPEFDVRGRGVRRLGWRSRSQPQDGPGDRRNHDEQQRRGQPRRAAGRPTRFVVLHTAIRLADIPFAGWCNVRVSCSLGRCRARYRGSGPAPAQAGNRRACRALRNSPPRASFPLRRASCCPPFPCRWDS